MWGSDGVSHVGHRAFHHHRRCITQFPCRCRRHQGAHAGAEQHDPPGVVRPFGADLIDGLHQVVPFKKAGGRESPATFPVGAQVRHQQVVSQRVPEWRPGNRTNLGVGIAVDQNRAQRSAPIAPARSPLRGAHHSANDSGLAER